LKARRGSARPIPRAFAVVEAERSAGKLTQASMAVKGNTMNRSVMYSRQRMGLTGLLVAALVAGCADSSSPTSDLSPMTPGTGPGANVVTALQARVLLGAAGNYVILSKSGISNIPTSAIIGNIGVSPIAATAITGFALVRPAGGTFAKSSQVTGNVYAANYAAPTPANLTRAVGDMQAAYTDAAGRKLPNHIGLGAGNIGGLTLAPGLYKWSNTVTIPKNVTLRGSATDVWIFQIAGGLTQASATKVILSGGAVARNVFWQVAGVVALGTTAHLEGVVLAKTAITLKTGASVHGSLFAQTAVTLASNRVVKQ